MRDLRQNSDAVSYDDEIDLREVFFFLWRSKWLIGGVTLATAVLTAMISLMLPNTYRAEALLAPNHQEGAAGLSSLAAQYGGLASLAGINVGANSTDKTALGLEILKSRKFISDFVKRHDILIPLMAAKRWDRDTGELEIDPDSYDVKSEKWMRKEGSSKNPKPSSQEAYERFSKIFSVGQDKKSGFVTITIEHYSPEVARQWVDWLIEDINSSIMHQDVDEAEQAIAYLQQQIAETSLAGLRNVFFSLIEEQTKTVMLAEIADEYMFRTLDPAVAPEIKSRPRRSLMVVFGAIMGFLIGTVTARILGARRSKHLPA